MCCSDGKACDLSVSPGGSSPTESSFHSFTILSKLRIATLATPSVCRSHTQLPVVTSLNKTLERCLQIPTVTKIGQHMVPKRKIHFKHFYWQPEDFRFVFLVFSSVCPLRIPSSVERNNLSHLSGLSTSTGWLQKRWI